MENTKEIIVTFEGKEWSEAIDKAYDKAKDKVKVDGFRAGKAPKDKIMKAYGENNLYMDAADLCLNRAYEKMVKEGKDLEVIAQPEVSLKSISKDKLEILFKLTLKPTITLGKYKKLGVKKETVKVTKEEIDKTIEEMRSKYTENVIKDDIAALGDTVIIDFEGFIEDKPFEGGKATNYSLKLGSNSFIPGFEDQLVGLKANDSKDVKVTFPKDYHSEDLKGKDATFKVTIHEVKMSVIPELDDNFFADLGMEGINSKETLEKEVKETIRVRKEMDNENKYVDDLLEAALKNTKMEVPDVLVEEEAHRMVHQYEETLKMQGITLEQFLQFTHATEADLINQMKDEAKKRVSYRLMLEEIAKKENINISDEEADKEAETLADKYKMTKEELLKEFGNLDMIKYDLVIRKAIDVLKSE